MNREAVSRQLARETTTVPRSYPTMWFVPIPWFVQKNRSVDITSLEPFRFMTSGTEEEPCSCEPPTLSQKQEKAPNLMAISEQRPPLPPSLPLQDENASRASDRCAQSIGPTSYIVNFTPLPSTELGFFHT